MRDPSDGHRPPLQTAPPPSVRRLPAEMVLGEVFPVSGGIGFHDMAEDAVELRVTAESGEEGGFDEGVAGASAVEAEKSFQTFSLAEGSEAGAGLALEKPAEPGGAESGFLGQRGQADRSVGVCDQARGLDHGWVNVGARNGFAGKLERLP